MLLTAGKLFVPSVQFPAQPDGGQPVPDLARCGPNAVETCEQGGDLQDGKFGLET